ncbi:MAG: hypothetical protein ACIALR_10575 [Blastopirellula sp. JB062]
MRILIAILAATLALSLVKLYLSLDEQRLGAAPQVETLEHATGTYRLEIEFSFDAGPDQFAADLENSTAVKVSFAGKTLYETADPLTAGEKIEIASIDQIALGENEFLLEAIPQTPGPPLFAKAAIYSERQHEPIAERFVWAPAGAPALSGAISFSASSDASEPGGGRP